MAVCIGCGLEVVDGLLAVDLKDGGGLDCDADGLFVEASVLDPISPDACNGISRRGNGLYAPCPDAITGNANCSLAPLTYDAIAPNASDFNSIDAASDTGMPGGILTITNTTCCTIAGRIGFRAGGLYGIADDGFYGSAELRINDNGAGLVGSIPDTFVTFENQCGTPVHTAFNNMVEENWVVFTAGESKTYACGIHFIGHTGTIHLSGTIKFEINYLLVQT